jgi:hypothetical protein
VANDAFQNQQGSQQFGRLKRIPAFRSERERPMPVRAAARRLIAMSQVEEAAARLTQARNEIALITERLLDIEARLVATKAAVIERPTKISLRKFTSNLLDQRQHKTIRTDKYVSRPSNKMPPHACRHGLRFRK